MNDKINILVVDDHQVVREGIARLLSENDGIELVGQGSNSDEAILQVEMFSPDIILMDIKMPGIDGVEITRQLKQRFPASKVIMLTLYDEYLNQAMEAGARGYLLKDIRREELLDAIRRVYSGEIIVSDSIRSKNKFMTEKPDSEDSGSTIEEIQLVLSPPVDAGQLMRFAGQAEEKLKSRVMQMVGAWEEGTVMTLSLNEATTLSTVVSMFKDIPEIDDINEQPLQENINPRLLKKATAVPKMGSKTRATLFVTLCKN